jgi:hypothetical protein
VTQVGRDGEAAVGSADLEVSLLERQLDAMERPAGRKSIWPWVLVVVGLLAIVALTVHASTAYATVARVNVNSRIDTPNPILLFQDVATNGPRLGPTVETSSRAIYSKALEQFLLDGTGVIAGVVFVIGGLFVRANQ